MGVGFFLIAIKPLNLNKVSKFIHTLKVSLTAEWT